MLEREPVGLAIVALQQVALVRHRQHVENAAAIVIQHHHDQRRLGPGQQRQAVEVVKRAGVAQNHRGGFIGRAGQPVRRGQQPIDARSPAIGHHPQRRRTGRAQHVHQPGGQAVAHEQRPSGQLRHLMTHPQLGKLRRIAFDALAGALLKACQGMPGGLGRPGGQRGDGLGGRAHQPLGKGEVRVQALG